VARSILIFLLVPSSVRYRVFSPSSPTFLCTAWQKWNLKYKSVCSNIFTRTSTVDCWHQLTRHKGMD
ncbi:hypothetical protein T05_6235, partial [Trichinella murrelli]